MSYEKEMPSNVSKEVGGKTKDCEYESRMGNENKKLIADYQKEHEDNRVGVPIRKWTQ